MKMQVGVIKKSKSLTSDHSVFNQTGRKPQYQEG